MTSFKGWELRDNKIISGHIHVPLDSVSYIGYAVRENPNKLKLTIIGVAIALGGLFSFSFSSPVGMILLIAGGICIFLAYQVEKDYRLYSQSGAYLVINEGGTQGGENDSDAIAFDTFATEVISKRENYLKSLR
jgi:hypothetical protein